MGNRSFEDLIVWQKSLDLVQEIYILTDSFPEKEKFGLVSQMRRSAVSIPSNIAEGSKRGSRKDFSHFLKIDAGSAAELYTQIIISRRLFNINSKKSEMLLNEIQKMLSVLISRNVKSI